MAQSAMRYHGRKLRVLCLHGMYQNGDVFAAKTAHLRRAHDELIEFVYMDAPFVVVPRILTQRTPPPQQQQQQQQQVNGKGESATDANGEGNAASSLQDRKQAQRRVRCMKKHDEFRAWWRPASGSHHVSSTQLDDDRAVLVAFLQDKLAALGDIDGVMGFSQGASLASWMCSDQARDELQWSPRLAILIGSYLGPQQYNILSGIRDDVSSLHLFGANDHVISATKSQEVADLFHDAKVHDQQVITSIHRQGHVVPKCDIVLGHVQTFLEKHHRDANGMGASAHADGHGHGPAGDSAHAHIHAA